MWRGGLARPGGPQAPRWRGRRNRTSASAPEDAGIPVPVVALAIIGDEKYGSRPEAACLNRSSPRTPIFSGAAFEGHSRGRRSVGSFRLVLAGTLSQFPGRPFLSRRFWIARVCRMAVLRIGAHRIAQVLARRKDAPNWHDGESSRGGGFWMRYSSGTVFQAKRNMGGTR